MKHLRQYIRRILLEVDFGDKIWADRADHGHISHHWGDEPDTEIEAKLWDALRKYMTNSRGIQDLELLQAIKDAAKNTKYQDIFITRDSPFWKDRSLMRGQSLPKGYIEEKLGISLPRSYKEASELPGWNHPWLTINLMDSFVYRPEDFFRPGTEVSSWTQDDETARSFALADMPGGSSIADSVIFNAVTGEGEFLDLRQMYKFKGMEEYETEEEYLALDDVPVDSIDVFYRDPDRGDW
jgi:hypothetical protein